MLQTMEIAPHNRVGLAATMGLHILLLGVWWLQPSHAPGAFPALQHAPAIEVFLHRSGGSGAQDARLPVATIPQDVEADTPVQVAPIQQAVPDDASEPPAVPPLPMKEAPYLAGGELDERPSSANPVIVPFPDAPLDAPKVSGILVLYVGTNGYVDRIEVDESDLPPEFEKAAIDTFLQARMRPGIKDGQPVRARMKILVEFEQR